MTVPGSTVASTSHQPSSGGEGRRETCYLERTRQSIVSQTNGGTVSKTNARETSKKRLERIWGLTSMYILN